MASPVAEILQTSTPSNRPFSSQAAGDQTVWADASCFLSAVCNDLEVGELVHGENFSMFEAMSALEIMDPKMDAAMSTGFNTVEEAVESGAAPIHLNILQLVDVMDHLLACEATWHRGHYLAQTVFSCLYLLKLDRAAPNALLHAYCKTTRATCSLIRAVVFAVHTNEEEDLFTFAFGLPIDGEGDIKCLSGLNLVEEVVARQLRGCKGVIAKKKVAEEIESLQEDPTLEEGYCQAILSRLRFRKALYHSVSYLNKPQGRGLEMAHKHIAMALSELSAIRESSKFLSSCCPNNCCKDTDNQLEVNGPTTASGQRAIGFDTSVNKRLSAPAPPRSIKIYSWKETLDYFEKLLQDLDHICSLPLNLSLEELLQVIVDFQKCHPDLVVRSFLQMLLVQDGKLFGREPVSDFLRRALSLPQTVVNKEFETDSFVVKSGQLLLHLLRALCTNMAWQRRKLGKILLEWGSLLQQMEMIHDNFLHKTLSSLNDKDWWENVIIAWAAEQTCWIAMHLLILGFELELYAPSEFCMVYWYLDHVLLTLLHYKHLQEKTFDHEQLKSVEAVDSTKKKGKKKKGTMKALEKEIHSTPIMLLIQCYADSCKGLSWMLSALTADRKVTYRQTIFNKEEERFLQRFELFHKVPVPQPLSYFQFKESTAHKKLTIKDQYQWANYYFMDLQQHLQELTHSISKAANFPAISRAHRVLEIRQLEQVALRNRIALQILDCAGPGDSLKVSFEFSQHPYFAVASIKKS